MPRNIVLSVVKGIAIILMVVGHAEAPDFLTRWIYTFHMPVFFIAAGYFSAAAIWTTHGASARSVSADYISRFLNGVWFFCCCTTYGFILVCSTSSSATGPEV